MQKESGLAPLILVIPLAVLLVVAGVLGYYYVQSRTAESGVEEVSETSTNSTSRPDNPESQSPELPEAFTITNPTPIAIPTPPPGLPPAPPPLPSMTPESTPSGTPSIMMKKDDSADDSCVLLFETSSGLTDEQKNAGCAQ